MAKRRRRKRPQRPDTRAVGYARASTSKQSLTVDAQTRRIQSFAQESGIELCGVFADEAKSGALELDRRAGWCALTEGIASHDAGLVVVVTLSRVARSVYLAAHAERELKILGAKLVDIETAHMGDGHSAQLTRNILHAVDEDERKRIGERTKRLLADLQSQGKAWNGTAPYGLRFVDGEVQEHPEEAKTIKALRRWRKRGISVRRCREMLESKGHPPRGTKWHTTTVARLIRRIEQEDQK